MNITTQELVKLKSTQTESDWNATCDEIKAERGGEYPGDWFSKILMSGVLDEATKRFDTTVNHCDTITK